MLELLMLEWEDRLENEEYKPIPMAMASGLQRLDPELDEDFDALWDNIRRRSGRDAAFMVSPPAFSNMTKLITPSGPHTHALVDSCLLGLSDLSRSNLVTFHIRSRLVPITRWIVSRCRTYTETGWDSVGRTGSTSVGILRLKRVRVTEDKEDLKVSVKRSNMLSAGTRWIRGIQYR